MKWIAHSVFVILYILVAFFGIGPVLLADGPDSERLWTLIVVIMIFAALIGLHIWSTRRKVH